MVAGADVAAGKVWPPAMRATAEAVEGSKVRLSVQVDESEVDRAMEQTVRKLAREVKVPGFRPGKVPRQVLEARMGGSGSLRSEALRDALPEFYARAVADTELDPIAPPEIEITDGEESGALTFDALVQVRPTLAIPGYTGLEVTIPSWAVSDEEIGVQVDRLRESDGELVEVQRKARDKDNATINLHVKTVGGEEVISADDFLYEIGSGNLAPELDEQLRGSKSGDVLAFNAPIPARGDEVLGFSVLVKDVKEKRLPEPTDEWVAENSEFSTLEELRADIAKRIREIKLLQARLAWQDASIGALVELVDDADVPEVLIDDEVRSRVHDLGHRLEDQGLNLEQFLRATGRDAEGLLAELRVDALREVKADLALRALADAEDLQVDDAEFEDQLAKSAERLDVTPKRLREQLDRSGRTGEVRSEQRKAKALTWLLDHVQLVDEEGSPASRDELRVNDGDDDRGDELEVSVNTEDSETEAPAGATS
jgi:trigger factor